MLRGARHKRCLLRSDGRAGREDLANDVRWVSDLDGDGFGYDVRSFEPDGAERL
jgi:hypothetical protein